MQYRAIGCRLYLAIKALAGTVNAGYESLRFWGRITTRNGSYYIVEGKTFEDLGEQMEGKDGVNKYTYWVTKSSKLLGIRSMWTVGLQDLSPFDHPGVASSIRTLDNAPTCNTATNRTCSPDKEVPDRKPERRCTSRAVCILC